MVVVPAGEFWMGSPDGKRAAMATKGPQHKVKIDKPFAVGKFEVTWDEWDACVAMRGCDGDRLETPASERGRRPVINVSWDQAKAYVAWLSRRTGKPYRLLTEAEWEYAARGVTSADAPHPPYPWGDKASHEYANYGTDRVCQGKTEGRDEWHYTAPVGQFPANAFGLHDMHGNVWEWVEDPWHERLSWNAARQTAALGRKVAMQVAVSSAAVPGATFQSTSARPTASGTPPTTGTSIWASGSPGRLLPLESFALRRLLLQISFH